MRFGVAEINLLILLPEIVLLAGATATIFFSGVSGFRKARRCAAVFILASLLSAMVFNRPDTAGFGGMMIKDQLTQIFLLLMDLAALFVTALSQDQGGEEFSGGEYFGLLLFALVGMHVMAAGRDLLAIFLGLEILAMPLYILVGFNRRSPGGMEGAVKYFFLGCFASAIFLLGLVFYYGATGKTSLQALAGPQAMPVLIFAGLALGVAGIGFKLAAAPFHSWAPDAYEGAPVSVAAFLSIAPKIAAFAFLLRLCLTLSEAGWPVMDKILLILSLASMIIGNFAALRQTGLVRMLAYSGIAHVGYMLIAMPALKTDGGAALSFYLLVYLAMNLGAFSVVCALGPRKSGPLGVDDLAGLAQARPFSAFALAVFMVSLAGIPPTGGFFAKFYLFQAGIAAGYLPVVLVAIVMSVVSLFYYLRVVMVMYMSNAPAGAPAQPKTKPVTGAVMAVLVLSVFATGIFPDRILKTILASF